MLSLKTGIKYSNRRERFTKQNKQTQSILPVAFTEKLLNPPLKASEGT